MPKDVEKNAVFACNELDLSEIEVYGFDYDYTLACYKQSLHYLLYDLGCNMLIEKYKVSCLSSPIDADRFSHKNSLVCILKKYPAEIRNLKYRPDFAIRGLHYDIEKGLLLKLDSFLQIQLGSVYRGRTQVSDAEVLRLYKNRVIPIAYVEGPSKSGSGVSV